METEPPPPPHFPTLRILNQGLFLLFHLLPTLQGNGALCTGTREGSKAPELRGLLAPPKAIEETIQAHLVAPLAPKAGPVWDLTSRLTYQDLFNI